ncbi:hypothetical protein AMTRI_Chr06g191620 [Amborella trichopoda]
MDSINAEKLKAMNKYKRNQFVGGLLFYPVCAVLLGLLLSSPLWLPSLYRYAALFLFVLLPRLTNFVMSPGFLFVLCNGIVLFLFGESRLVGSSNGKPDLYEEYIKRNQSSIRASSTVVEKVREKNTEKVIGPAATEVISVVEVSKIAEREEEERDEEEVKRVTDEGEGEEESGLPTDELNKRVEDFIARVNHQRRLEAKKLLICRA